MKNNELKQHHFTKSPNSFIRTVLDSATTWNVQTHGRVGLASQSLPDLCNQKRFHLRGLNSSAPASRKPPDLAQHEIPSLAWRHGHSTTHWNSMATFKWYKKNETLTLHPIESEQLDPSGPPKNRYKRTRPSRVAFEYCCILHYRVVEKYKISR